jgi:hypothetical protein
MFFLVGENAAMFSLAPMRGDHRFDPGERSNPFLIPELPIIQAARRFNKSADHVQQVLSRLADCGIERRCVDAGLMDAHNDRHEFARDSDVGSKYLAEHRRFGVRGLVAVRRATLR